MPRILVLGAGVAGHTAAMYAKRMLGKQHEVTVVSPNSKWNWIPSNIWVGAACIASVGNGILNGSAATITRAPIVPDLERFPQSQGRDPELTAGELGLAGHWIKRLLHTMFIYKAKGLTFWWMIPE